MSIATLVPELLSKIFIHHVAAYEDAYNRDYSSTRFYLWIRIAHISRYWRAVALDCSTLWTFIPLLRPQCVEAMLARSGQAPLRLDFASDHHVESLRLALDHMHRINEVKVTTIPDRCVELDALKDAPALERLTVRRCSFMWTDAMLQQHRLKELVIDLPVYRLSSLLEEMLRALEGIPTLEVLSLTCVVHMMYSTGDSEGSESAITLPRLRLLRIWDEAYQIPLLLSRIICPTTTAIVLELDGILPSPDLPGLVNAISSRLKGEAAIGTVQPLLALDIADTIPFIQLRGWTSGRPIDTLEAREDSPSVTFCYGDDRVPEELFETICRETPLSTVRDLSIGSLRCYEGPKASWNVFLWATSVESLWISQWSVKHLLEARLFDLPDELMHADGRQHLLPDMSFPRLTTLRLDNISSDSEESADAERLKVLLDLRYKYGGLKLLILRQFDELSRLYDGLQGTDTNVLAVHRLAILT